MCQYFNVSTMCRAMTDQCLAISSCAVTVYNSSDGTMVNEFELGLKYAESVEINVNVPVSSSCS